MFHHRLAVLCIAWYCSVCMVAVGMDEPPLEGESISDRSVTVKLSDMVDNAHDVNDFPSHACYCPGRPATPKWKRPGDINLKDCPPERYQMDDCERSGHPHCIAPWAKCAINERYSAWYVGGGTAWLLPGHARQRREEEGTWGLDYNGLMRPRRVWLNWSFNRHQSAGTYATD